MICERCKTELDVSVQERNAEAYGSNYYACPKCGKLYCFFRTVIVNNNPFNYGIKEDDWGHQVVTDEEYYKTK